MSTIKRKFLSLVRRASSARFFSVISRIKPVNTLCPPSGKGLTLRKAGAELRERRGGARSRLDAGARDRHDPGAGSRATRKLLRFGQNVPEVVVWSTGWRCWNPDGRSMQGLELRQFRFKGEPRSDSQLPQVRPAAIRRGPSLWHRPSSATACSTAHRGRHASTGRRGPRCIQGRLRKPRRWMDTRAHPGIHAWRRCCAGYCCGRCVHTPCSLGARKRLRLFVPTAGRNGGFRARAEAATASGITTTARSFMRKILWKAHWNSNPDLLFRREPSFPLYDGPVGIPGQTRTGILQLR